MKPLVFMILTTIAGTAGALLVSPFLGVAVYYLFAVMRPPFLWWWVLPEGVRWSLFVAVATILAAVLVKAGLLRLPPPREGDGARGEGRFGRGHAAVLVFGLWVAVTALTAKRTDVSYPWLWEYAKIFAMFACAAFLVRTLRQVWILFLIATASLAYIAYEVNILYLADGRLDIYHDGFGGYDNNGAALVLAMGVPFCLYAWEGTARWWRWGFLVCIPPIIHAVLMTYSRGAMVSLLAAAPILYLRSRHKPWLTAGGLLLAFVIVPALAGKEQRERFLTMTEAEPDASARSRLGSWTAGLKMAVDHPVLGVGVRNADLFSYRYGADIRGRAIHSVYIQLAADSGFVGLGLYLLAIVVCLRAAHGARRAVLGRTDDDARRVRAIASGCEGAMAVFCAGAAFLSLEVLELPYLVLLLAAQLGTLLTPAAAPPDRPTARDADGGEGGGPPGAPSEDLVVILDGPPVAPGVRATTWRPRETGPTAPSVAAER